MSAIKHSDRALRAALDAMGPCHEGTATLLLFLAVGKHLGCVLDRERAAEVAYSVADGLATGTDLFGGPDPQ